jgi:hypothetical protein
LSLKPGTYTESINVGGADISVKVSVHYPGRSLNWEKGLKKLANTIVVTIEK